MEAYKNVGHKAVSMNWQELATALRRAEFYISKLELDKSALTSMLNQQKKCNESDAEPIGHKIEDENDVCRYCRSENIIEGDHWTDCMDCGQGYV